MHQSFTDTLVVFRQLPHVYRQCCFYSLRYARIRWKLSVQASGIARWLPATVRPLCHHYVACSTTWSSPSLLVISAMISGYQSNVNVKRCKSGLRVWRMRGSRRRTVQAQLVNRACKRSGSGRISARRSNLFLWLPLPAPWPPAPAPLQPFFHTRSPLRSRSPDFWPAPLLFRSNVPSSRVKKWTDFSFNVTYRPV